MTPEQRASLTDAVRYAKKALRADSETTDPVDPNPPGWAYALLQDVLDAAAYAQALAARDHPA